MQSCILTLHPGPTTVSRFPSTTRHPLAVQLRNQPFAAPPKSQQRPSQLLASPPRSQQWPSQQLASPLRSRPVNPPRSQRRVQLNPQLNTQLNPLHRSMLLYQPTFLPTTLITEVTMMYDEKKKFFICSNKCMWFLRLLWMSHSRRRRSLIAELLTLFIHSILDC